MNYLEKFAYSKTEKTNRKTKKATTTDVENFLFELEKLAESIEDDSIKNECMGVIAGICEDREICPCCYTKIDEAYEFDVLIRACNCDSLRKVV